MRNEVRKEGEQEEKRGREREWWIINEQRGGLMMDEAVH